tara:strand:- start:982 stop:1152 length:171 start_codon:yes stop_codon:yes gene_type:complete
VLSVLSSFLPALHGEQEALPFPAVILPLGHAMQLFAIVTAVNVSSGQTKQLAWPAN